jgi:hypothetical protein
MSRKEKLIAKMRRNPGGIRFPEIGALLGYGNLSAASTMPRPAR